MNGSEVRDNEVTERLVSLGISVTLALVLIAILTVSLPSSWSDLLLNTANTSTYPFTVQNLMWVFFAAGLGELIVRFRKGSNEMRQLRKRLLPEDDSTMLRAKDLGSIYTGVRPGTIDAHFFLQRLLARAILQFQSSKSVDQATTLVNASLELMQHEIDLRYSMIRYLVWLIPTMGFIGTVIGITLALTDAKAMSFEDPQAAQETLAQVTTSLGLAFNTTLLALVLSAVLVLMMHIAQQIEEGALNRSGQYCLDNLINRLYER